MDADSERRELAKWKRRVEENKFIRENLLDKANMLSYTIQRLSARRRGLGVVDLYTIWRLLGQGYSIDDRDDNGVPPLVHCAIRGWLGVILMFGQHHYDVNVTSTLQETAVCAACRRGHMTIVRYLILRDADLSVCDRSGFSCLRWAAKHRNKSLVRLLLQRGVSVQKDCGTVHNSALDWARQNHDEAIEDMLVTALVEEKRDQMAKLQQSAQTKQARVAAPIVDVVEAKTSDEIKEEQRQARLEQVARDRDTAFRERVDVLYRQQSVQAIKSIRPVEVKASPVPVAETEWHKKKPMAWVRVALPLKRLEPATPHVDMKRIRQLMATDDDEEGCTLGMDAMASFAQRAQPKAPSLAFYCPEFE